MKTVFVFDQTDLNIYTSSEAMIDNLEAQDVRRGEYRCFRGDGREILLLVKADDQGERIILRPGVLNVAAFRRELENRLINAAVTTSGRETIDQLKYMALSTFNTL